MAILILGGHIYGASNCSFNHPESPYIGFGGSRMKTVATRAINVYSRRVGAAWFQPLLILIFGHELFFI